MTIQAKANASKPQKRGTAVDAADTLQTARAAVVNKLATVADATFVAKCEAMLIGFDELAQSVRELAPNVEQLKGMAKGLSLAIPMVAQHVELLKGKLPDLEQAELLRFGLQVVQDCKQSVSDGWRKQQEEMVRTLGRFDGGVNGALAVLRKIEQLITHHEQMLQAEAELNDDPFAEVRTAPEEPGENGSKKRPPRRRGRKPRQKTGAESAN